MKFIYPGIKRGILIAFWKWGIVCIWFCLHWEQVCGEIHIIFILYRSDTIILFYIHFTNKLQHSVCVCFSAEITQNKLKNNKYNVRQHALLMDIAITHVLIAWSEMDIVNTLFDLATNLNTGKD